MTVPRRASLLALAMALVAAAPPTIQPAPSSRLAPFAATLADRDLPAMRGAWPRTDRSAAWAAIAQSTAANRQSARWALAQTLLADRQFADALGVLDTMARDDADLPLVAAWQLAHGIALAALDRPSEALSALGSPSLLGHPEACAWRARAMVATGDMAGARGLLKCALPAIAARTVPDQAPFLLTFADAAVVSDRPRLAIDLLGALDDRDPAANLRRGRALLAAGDIRAGTLLLDRASRSGTPDVRAAAQLALIAQRAAGPAAPPAAATAALDQLLRRWRGDAIEREALDLRWRLAERRGDTRAALAAGATLFRYFDLGAQTAPTLSRLQQQLRAVVSGDARSSVDDIAGTFWDYRDLLPGGAEGEALTAALAERLTAAGLYGRAAELMRTVLDRRPLDAATGPLSVRVAHLYLRADDPEAALRVLRRGAPTVFPQPIQVQRRQIEAIALFRLGKANEALAILDDVPDTAALQAELLWQKRDWPAFARVARRQLPDPRRLDATGQAMVLRQLVALTNIGDAAGVTVLRRRYASAFAPLPSRDAFALLTDPVDALDAAKVDKAFSRLTAANPDALSLVAVGG
ncbi:endoglucanase [Sphingomonas hylomeconis]|uniref:Endoglucanase n=1 Tax=Sphingomonas hylomeconis TaxID=1395958 RepID=A0ABV7SR26_9SPHN|nr:endoglucanase [Sphingomonas hylomeconis]